MGLINNILESGIFPNKLKIFKVISIYKKSESTNLKIYWPIIAQIPTLKTSVFNENYIPKNFKYEFLHKNNMEYTKIL